MDVNEMHRTEVDCNGERVELLPDRALYWSAGKTLIIADAHFGKAANFRKSGIPVPGGTTDADLTRLEMLLHATHAERLIVLGDFFHASVRHAPATLERLDGWWRKRSSVRTLLIRGNHDRQAGDPPAEWHIECVNEPYAEGPFSFRHEPSSVDGKYTLAGHFHPAVRLQDGRAGTLRLPCFCVGTRRAILPAFGRFTGAKVINPGADDRIFATDGESIVEVGRPR
jgi:DNA ligase-associated metallophosphoesterase